MVSFVSFAFISALIFKISFLLVNLGFFIFSFSSALGVELGYLFGFILYVNRELSDVQAGFRKGR